MSWPKACLGRNIDWIGAHFSYDSEGVHVGIPEKKVTDLTTEIKEHLSSAAMSLKRARSLAGGTGFIAGIIPW